MRRSLQRVRRGWLLLPLSRHPARFRSTPFILQPLDNHATPKEAQKDSQPNGDKQERSKFARSVLEGSTVALISLFGLGLGGYAYSLFYKHTMAKKIENAFATGYSSQERVALGRISYGTEPEKIQEIVEREYWVPRAEQEEIDNIVNGKARGRYYLVIGERGTGKRALLLQAMRKVNGDGIAMLEAHNDLEVFRTRLGKAIDYEFHEDYIGGLFSIRGPRDSSPLLDIERALNQMEKVALRLRKRRGKPLLMIINNIHLFKDDEAGKHLLEILQQRAEIWAGNELVTTVFTSDEFWTLERLTPHATDMHVLNIRDVRKDVVTKALKQYRARYHNEDVPQNILDHVFAQVGGRLIFLNQVAKSRDMLDTCEQINRREKSWFLNNCWILGDSMDDDVEEQQKYCAAAIILARALVLREKPLPPSPSPSSSPQQFSLPQIPLHEARQIITRADFIHLFDHINVFHIDAHGMVRADSVPMQNAFRDVVLQPGFEQHLMATLNRLDELESLARTREVAVREAPGRSGGVVPVQEFCAKL
ncbi:ATPase [Pyrenophora tritici-repentis]|uniref:ATPase n=1 Tax=Pyrenophora tritici-repentis TaxID=45151 RepID=A0A2W1EW28_9PLEO|nr:ATPase [Pyrenophora tritici-repentis]KAF7446745.1 ATPase [Pyrenophora tritici-repentis]KAF7569018.1 ATPase [Pyrenophora tritici-repentis]KAI0586021.1 ATPase [Pyrenophora tritici-repentis]KAI0589042.1 ATPase [Pyrenophora tritici-repentis]